MKLEESKRKRIINTAVDEFVKYGYEKASTNSITKQAGISKGSLFSYFESKEKLYIYLIDYGIHVINKLYKEIDYSERDLFQRLENIGIQKIKIQSEYPYIFDFFKTLKQEKSSIVKSTIQSKFTLVTNQGIEKIYHNIDYTKFRDDIDIDKAIEILNWAMFGFSERTLNEINTFKHVEQIGEKYLNKWHEYSEFLKKIFYK
ncbi:MAG: TetR/AcrR family transcriptional regulator [Acholeplasmataceae bacterium]|nr:TetR/AcrR family transcriptional regulator [Acholeplasmataceae bacterium]